MTPWDVLGLVPTNDKREIRKAYAALLKGLDVDGDTQAFERLRRARDWALASADSDSVNAMPTIEDGETLVEEAPPAEAAEPMPEWLSELARHHAALMAILSAGDGRTPTDVETQATMVAHFEALLHDPRLSDVGFQADAEQWFAQTVAHACPRADPLVLPAARRFGWLEDGDKVGRSDEIVWLTRRARAFLFLEEVQQPKHLYHREWVELCTPAGEGSKRNWRIRRKKVLQLLSLVRGTYPTLESSFDWYRVSLWETNARKGANWPVRIVAYLLWFALVAGVHLFGSDHGNTGRTYSNGGSSTLVSDPAAQAGPSLSDVNTDIDAALQPTFGGRLTAHDLALGNPRLFAILQNYWKTDRNAGTSQIDFGDEIRELLVRRFPGDLRKADYPLVSGFRRFELDQLQDAASMSYGICDSYITGSSPEPLSDQMMIRRNALVGQILLHADDGAPQPKPQTLYMVPGEVVTRAVAKSGLTLEQFKSAMHGQGTAETRCRKQISLLQTALALPENSGLSLLRSM